MSDSSNDRALPAPFVPAEVDLRDFPHIPLDVVRIRDARLITATTGEEFKSWLLLMCASWHQIPAGSLPDDDKELAMLAGYGRFPDEWMKVRQGSLYGWTKCSDGRLHHRVVAEKAMAGWAAKMRELHRRDRDRHRKSGSSVMFPDFEIWDALRNSSGNSTEFRWKPPPIPAENPGIPLENGNRRGDSPPNRSEGKGSELKGSELNRSEGNGSEVNINPETLKTLTPGGPPASPQSPARAQAPAHTRGGDGVTTDPLFGGCIEFLVGKGVDERRARTFVALVRKQYDDTLVFTVFEAAREEDVTKPIPWIQRGLAARQQEGGRPGKGVAGNKTVVDAWANRSDAIDGQSRRVSDGGS